MASLHPVATHPAVSGGLELTPAAGRVTLGNPTRDEAAALGALRGLTHSVVREILVEDDGSSPGLRCFGWGVLLAAFERPR